MSGNIFRTLLDPMGLPVPAIIFQILMVLTFTLHIIFVNLLIGSFSLSLYGYVQDGYWKRLSGALSKVISVAVSFAILMGVAPLLFVQVLYDPLWYTSSVLSAWWVMGFVVFMMTAYSLSYLYYLRGALKERSEKALWLVGIISFCLFLLSGFIIHVISYQGLFPEKWVRWYTSGGGIHSSGKGIYAFSIVRFLHFIVPSFAVTGVFLMLYSWYFRMRKDFEGDYLNWVGSLGAKLAFYASIVQAAFGIWWLLSLPSGFRFYLHPAFWVSVAFALFLFYILYKTMSDPQKYALTSGGALFATIFAMAYSREFLRMKYLVRAGYSIFERKVMPDWGSFLLFLITFLIGLVVAGFLYALTYKAGRREGVYEPTSGEEKFASAAIKLIIAWIVAVVLLGVFITFRYTLS